MTTNNIDPDAGTPGKQPADDHTDDTTAGLKRSLDIALGEIIAKNAEIKRLHAELEKRPVVEASSHC